MGQVLYTIGHSTRSLSTFLDLLIAYGVSTICDVRSQPYSRRNPQFNRESLKDDLARLNITYVFLGEELGARSSDPTCYEDGKVQYARLAVTDTFVRGIERLTKGIRHYQVALLCAEKDPLFCHRAILVCRNLRAHDLTIVHILDKEQVETHEASEIRLMKLLGMYHDDLFQPSNELLEKAYDLQGQRIAYSTSPEQPHPESAGKEENT